MTQVVVFGTGALAEMAHFYFTHDSPYEVVAFTADSEYIDTDEFKGLPIVAFEEVQKEYPPDKYDMFVAVGYRNVNKIRAQKYDEAKQKGYQLVSYVNSKVTHWGDTEIGDNCFIFEDQTIQPFVEIGDNVVIWSGNHIGHHSKIGDHCFITSHVVISGYTEIKPYSFLGVNATLRDDITVARENVIGAGAVIVEDTQEKGVYIGESAELYSDDSSEIGF